jgi:ketosteroid isomerase-like protein
MELADWIEGYRRAWEENDAELLLTLFTEDASYRSSPFREPSLGHAGIRAYWERTAGTQRGVEVRMGEPVVEGNVVAVEWWTTMDEADDGEITLPGCLLLQFAADGRCFDLREYWNVADGRLPPHDGWGSWGRR